MKTIIITGANGGLGSAVTQKFLDSGYRVVATVRKEEDKATMQQHALLDIRIADLSSATECASLVHDVVAQYGQVHGALMLAGGFAIGNIQNTTAADISKMTTLNFETALNIAQPLFVHMQEHGHGRLVFIGARPALQAKDGKSALAYALSKSLLFRLAECLNAEAHNKDIVSTVIAPSTIDTPANRKSMPDADPDNWVKPEQLADILEFICSDKSGPLRETVLKVYNNA